DGRNMNPPFNTPAPHKLSNSGRRAILYTEEPLATPVCPPARPAAEDNRDRSGVPDQAISSCGSAAGRHNDNRRGQQAQPRTAKKVNTGGGGPHEQSGRAGWRGTSV